MGGTLGKPACASARSSASRQLREKGSANPAHESVPGEFAERRKSVIRQVHHGGETSGTAGEINRTARGEREGAGGKARGACGKTASCSPCTAKTSFASTVLNPATAASCACTMDIDFPGQARRIHAALIAAGEMRGQLIRVNRPAGGSNQ